MELPDKQISEQEEDVVPLKKPALDDKQVLLWKNRMKTANKFHRKKIVEKYKTAKKRYNSEAYGFQANVAGKWTHQTFNFLYKDIEDFNGSTYFKNPQLDLTCRNTQDPVQIRNIENLEQDTNDDIKDNASLKALIRSCMVDESLAGLGAVYIDYDYRTQDSEEAIVDPMTGQPQVDDQQQPMMKQEEVANEVRPVKIMPENLIYPPFQTLYNYQEAPYLGFIDIVSLECLKNDPTLDQTQVSLITGKSYLELSDTDKQQLESDNVKLNDDLLYAKVYMGWIKGDDGGLLKRIVLADDSVVSQPLAYEDWDKGNGADGKGYPVHILALNDPCEGFVPPSEAWILESILVIIDFLMVKMLKHLKRSKTRVLVKGGKDGMKKENIDKWLSADDLEVISLNNLPPGLNIQSLIQEIADVPLSADHNTMFELCKRVFDELSRKPSFGQAAILEQTKTATEANAIQQQDTSQGAYKTDKLKDFLVGLFGDWARLKQKNYRGQKTITINNGKTGQEEPREVVAMEGRNDLEGEFNCDINITTFTAPNKEMKRRIIFETIQGLQSLVPLLGGKKKINGDRAVMDYVENTEVRNPDEYLIDVPLRTVDQQLMDLAFKGQPMSIEDLGGDYQGAIQRCMALFADHELMAKMEPMIPGISGGGQPQQAQGMPGSGGQPLNPRSPEGGQPMQAPSAPESPLILMAKDLEAMIQQAQKPSNHSQASSDVGMGAIQMAGAQ